MNNVLERQTHHEVEIGSERGFGLVFAAFFALIGLWPLIAGGTPRWWGLALATVFLVLALARPQWLAPLNRLWFRFGLLLGKVVAPIVMMGVFYVAVAPTGMLLRWFGKDLLGLARPPKGTGSLWHTRDRPEDKMGSMKNQF